MVRIISRSTFNAHTEPIFKQLKILNLYNICRLQMGKIMFSFKIDRLPDAPKILFPFSSSNHCYYTRQSNSFYMPPCRTNIKHFALSFQGPKFFDSLNIKIQNVGTLSLCLNCEHYSYVDCLLILISLFIFFHYYFFLLFSCCFSRCLFECLLLLLFYVCVCPFLFNLKYFVYKLHQKNGTSLTLETSAFKIPYDDNLRYQLS